MAPTVRRRLGHASRLRARSDDLGIRVLESVALILGFALALGGCTKAAPEHEAERRVTPPIVPEVSRVQGDWFELELPRTWVTLPPQNLAPMQAAEGAWQAPPGSPEATVIVGSPVTFAGEIRTFVDLQLPGLAAIGFTPTAQRAGTLGGASAWVLDVQAPGRTGRGWHFAREGLAGSLQCNGAAPDEKPPATCDRIGASFRFVGPLPQAPQPSPARDDSGRVELAGFRFALPQGWKSVRINVPTVWTLRSDEGFSAVMTIPQPFEGDLAAYDALGAQQLRANGAQLLGKKRARLFGVAAFELEYQHPPAAGGHRSLSFGTVKNGQGYVLTCGSAPAVAAALRGVCRKLAASIELLPALPAAAGAH